MLVFTSYHSVAYFNVLWCWIECHSFHHAIDLKVIIPCANCSLPYDHVNGLSNGASALILELGINRESNLRFRYFLITHLRVGDWKVNDVACAVFQAQDYAELSLLVLHEVICSEKVCSFRSRIENAVYNECLKRIRPVVDLDVEGWIQFVLLKGEVYYRVEINTFDSVTACKYLVFWFVISSSMLTWVFKKDCNLDFLRRRGLLKLGFFFLFDLYTSFLCRFSYFLKAIFGTVWIVWQSWCWRHLFYKHQASPA